MFRKVDSGLSDQKIERLKEKQTGRQTKTDKERYTNRQRQIDKQTDRQTEREKDDKDYEKTCGIKLRKKMQKYKQKSSLT